MAVVYASARDRLGQTLAGKYVLEDVVGVGGTAVVYRAKRLDGSTVALKMLHDYLGASEEVCRRFKREAYVANMLEHPGTVRVLDDGTTEDGVSYLVLEMLDGESVEERRLRFGGQLPLEEVFAIADQLLSVLEIAHAKSVVHRDIKPSNLFVTSDMGIKVLDFGIARIVDDTSATSTKTGQMVGTPAFMPPEQALSRPRDVDARTDIWAVGATMFTLLSGHHVHLAESSSEHLVKAATVPARSLAKALPGVPANVEALVAKALAFSKDDRWPSARAMRDELSRVRLDPGRRIGTSTFPPPAHLGSEPTFITGERSNLPLRQERTSDPSNISVVGDAKRASRSNRGWVVGAILGAALFAGTLGFFAARSTPRAVASTPRQPVATTTAPVLAPLPTSPAAASPLPATATAAIAAAPTAAAAPPKKAAAAPPAARATTPAKKPATTVKPNAPVDVYKPF